MTQLTYKSAGVDLDRYQEAMSRLPWALQRTHTPRVVDLAGGFAGLFRLDFNSRLFERNYREPVLVSGTDGVGTKLKIAQRARSFRTVGQDLVAMCVNDCLCVGAQPLFFLDYLAFGSDEPELVNELVRGVSDACLVAESALLGGETAVMPDIYQPGDFDMAGFSVGVVERKKIIDGRTIRPGDVLIGVGSSGFHSNGFSLIRKVVFEHAGLGLDDPVPETGRTVGDLLLEPTRIYVRPLMSVLDNYSSKSVVRGIAHITGGGLPENIERILPAGCEAVVSRSRWTVPPEFGWLQRLGNIADDEMFRVFNMGIGMVLIVRPYFAESVCRQLRAEQLEATPIGEIGQGTRRVIIDD